ncbi:hypothetical protein AHF37_07635 [Paragonimus kellicotti]|nr:hypothetical protein AHF37_07635 [Paragonimus kellicotti]
MSIPSLDEPLKDVIRNIVWCSGEPLVVSSEVVELFFNHLRSCCTSIANRLPNNQPSLSDLLNAVRYDTLKLARIFDYFKILSGSQDLNFSSKQRTGCEPYFCTVHKAGYPVTSYYRTDHSKAAHSLSPGQASSVGQN